MSVPSSIPEPFRRRLRLFGVGSAIWIAGFSATLVDLFGYCLRDDLFSYILLIPVITGVLVVRCRRELALRYSPAPGVATVLGIAAALLLLASFHRDGSPGVPDVGSLGLRTLGFVSGWVAIAVWTLGGRFMSGLIFPAAFLVFMVPLPPGAVAAIERGLQLGSAEVSSWLFPVFNVPFFRTDLSFQLPNITIHVGPECSGIRSTLVLFITSLVAGYLLLERSWQRVALTLMVIPLGILRNAFRIVTIGWLCTRYGPEMIQSPIHHRGGPLFFAVSLLPLFAMLLIFRKLGKGSGHRVTKHADSSGITSTTDPNG